jgi:type I restriction enzyme, S subunit
MSVRLQPYPAYKDSGIEWLGQIPAHWEMHRLDRLFTLRKESPQEVDERVTGYLDGRVTLRSNVAGQKIKGVVKEAAWQRIYPGDFAISGMNAHLGGMGVSDSMGKCSPIYLVLQPHESTNAQYVAHAVRFIAYTGILKTLVNTIRFNSADFKRDDLKQIRVWLPSPDEQQLIVRFIGLLNSRTNRLIRIKRRLIELLNEQKQALIHRAVTRGLAPDVPLKPSGIEWLGDIPAHWEVRQIKQLLVRADYGTSANLNSDGSIRVLTMGHIRDGEIIPPEHGSLDAVSPDLILEYNDLLFNRTNSPELVGKVGIFRGSLADNISFASYLVRLRARPEYCPEWLNYLLNSASFWNYAKSQALVSLHQANLNSTRYGRMLVPVPPSCEHKVITNHLKACLAQLHGSIAIAQREIELIREYRTCLIANIVTGKLDVREAINAPFPVSDAEEEWESVVDEIEVDEDVIDGKEAADAED